MQEFEAAKAFFYFVFTFATVGIIVAGIITMAVTASRQKHIDTLKKEKSDLEKVAALVDQKKERLDSAVRLAKADRQIESLKKRLDELKPAAKA